MYKRSKIQSNSLHSTYIKVSNEYGGLWMFDPSVETLKGFKNITFHKYGLQGIES